MTLNYKTWGSPEQPALIMLHGFLGSAAEWEPVAKQLSDQFYCIAVDLPGHGESKAISLPEDKAFEAFDEQLLVLADSLRLEKYNLLGYSMGGRLAMNHMLAYPDQVEHVIVESANPGLSSELERGRRRMQDQQWTRRLRDEPLEEVLHDWYTQSVFADMTEEQRQQLVEQRKDADPVALADMLQATSIARQKNLWQLMTRGGFSLGYICGSKDARYREVGRRLLQRSPGVLREQVAGAGHNVHLYHEEQFVQAFRQLFSALQQA
ncbi:2-succinyl-6-hydroxy-2,4-cyclohexadiene-1-carboxylate synthase [Endozoicomonadaceae bacterium StTr2]